MNKLGIPAKGTHFCSHCFEFHEVEVQVSEKGSSVTVTLTCVEYNHVETISDLKSTFFEYDDERDVVQ